jgi:esterase/lipase superfamily enzyme
MSNLTFDEKLVRECEAEPLEGHTVVVLERVGEKGEKFHSLLEHGAERPRQNPFALLLGKPNPYVAYAVDASRGRSLSFTEHVQMAERVHDFDLHFSLWYRVGDPQLLVATRNSDPLEQVRRQVAKVVTEEMAEQPWGDVWHAFRPTSESVVARTMAEIKAFAREYGITITTLRLRGEFPKSAVETDLEIHQLQERGRVGKVRVDVSQELHEHRRTVRRGSAEDDEFDRAEAARQEVQKKMREKYIELIGTAGSVEELRDLQTRLSGGSAGGLGMAGLPGQGGSAALGVEDEISRLRPGGDRLYRVWYATNRRPTDDGFKVGYGAQLDEQVHFGSCDVVIPASHKIGSLGSSWIRRFLSGTDDRLRLYDVVPMEKEGFWTSIRHHAASFTPEHRHALVFIHGFRVSFKDAALRAAQLGYDLNVQGPVAFFSWPSRASLIGYVADGSAVEASEEAIAEFLTQFARNCGADRVHVIAHSMGNRPLLRALQRIVSAPESEPAVRFGHLVLAAPDINRELFLGLADKYQRISHRTTLYVSDEDRALRASFRLQGPRVGLAPPVTCVDGIDTVHVAHVDRTLLGHSTFAEARPMLYDMHALLNHDAPPERRAGLIERQQGHERYWEVRP